MVTSSFALWPGLPVHRSTDLVHWELAGHVLSSRAALDALALDDLDLSDGVWAPTVRHHRGTFYVVFSTARDRRGAGTFVCTAQAPEGPWSDPVAVDAPGIDPSLFFDGDRCWLTACRDATDPAASGPGELWMRELKLDPLEVVGPEHVLWHGAVHGAWVEAPHVFERDGRYHLIAAEGGTERHHAVTAAVADHVTGPWRTDPRSPLLTHRHLGTESGVQNVGHADVVDAVDGTSWAVVLGTRPVDGSHVMGREVFLVPVRWDAGGPVFAPGHGRLPERLDLLAEPHRKPADRWVSLRGPVEHAVHSTAAGRTHVLAPRPDPLTGRGTPALVGRHQDAHRFSFSAELELGSLPRAARCGIVAHQHERAFLALDVVTEDGAVGFELVLQSPAGRRVLAHRAHGPLSRGDRALLELRGDERSYTASVQLEDGARSELGSVAHHELATERVGGFLGVLLALHAQGAATERPVAFGRVSYDAVGEEECACASSRVSG